MGCLPCQRRVGIAVFMHQHNISPCAGIMQLAMLAPYSNLASSVAAALVPTLLAPRFHQGEVPSKCGKE